MPFIYDAANLILYTVSYIVSVLFLLAGFLVPFIVIGLIVSGLSRRR